MAKTVTNVLTIIWFFCTVLSLIDGHGLLLEPPSRSSMWRFGYDTPPNYDDNELFCGGFVVQYDQNKGLCGVCGDNYAQPHPRDNERNGLYDSGIISRDYNVGDIITASVQLTANHRGWFEFRVCPYADEQTTEVSQDCLDQHLLKLADGSGTRFHIPDDSPSYVTFNINLQLPEDLSCDHCLLQWHYNTANSWGRCSDGEETLGCGNQENFRGCADISIQ